MRRLGQDGEWLVKIPGGHLIPIGAGLLCLSLGYETKIVRNGQRTSTSIKHRQTSFYQFGFIREAKAARGGMLSNKLGIVLLKLFLLLHPRIEAITYFSLI